MKGRFRKGKKASRTAEAFPIWWSGSMRQQKLQIRYWQFLRMKEWMAEMTTIKVRLVLCSTSTAMTIAMYNAMPRPMDMEPQEWARQKADHIAQAALTGAIAISEITKQAPPKPKTSDIVKPLFTT